MQEIARGQEACPFAFNFDPLTFAAGDAVSYRIPDRFDEFAFVGTLLAVHADHVEISPNDPLNPAKRMRGTRESRPVVLSADAL
jgi:hypothetical protein